jgi:hypothetical protein
MASPPATVTAEARKDAGGWLHPSNRIAAYSSGESRDQRGAVKGREHAGIQEAFGTTLFTGGLELGTASTLIRF